MFFFGSNIGPFWVNIGPIGPKVPLGGGAPCLLGHLFAAFLLEGISTCVLGAILAPKTQHYSRLPLASQKMNKGILKGFLRIYVFKPFWTLKPVKTILNLVLEVLLEVLEVVLVVLVVLQQCFPSFLPSMYRARGWLNTALQESPPGGPR